MKIQVLGSGCAKCKKLYEVTQEVVKNLGLKAEVEYVTGDKGMQAIIEIGVMSSPVLAIDGKVVMTGFTNDVNKIRNILTSGQKAENKTGACRCGGNC